MVDEQRKRRRGLEQQIQARETVFWYLAGVANSTERLRERLDDERRDLGVKLKLNALRMERVIREKERTKK